MKRLDGLLSWFFTCLGIVLVGVSILVVPQDAFAAYNGECSGTDDPQTCCAIFCAGDSNCIGICCGDACTGKDPSCTADCYAGVVKCASKTCDLGQGGCAADCKGAFCNDGGKDPSKSTCIANQAGCRCYQP
jgi:hypothetical protein